MSNDRQLPPLLIASLAGIGGAALVMVGVFREPVDVVVALIVATGLLVPVRVPWGGSVPMGVAGVTATVALLGPTSADATLAVALVIGGVVLVCRASRSDAINCILRLGAGMVGACAAVALLRAAANAEVPTLALAATASAGLVLGDLALARFGPTNGIRMDVRSAVPVHLTLACAGALIAVAVAEVGVAMAAVAAFPLLITRFSFDRHAGATDTLEQTVQALGLVPELAGLTPLGHSERSAAYATALARKLGFERTATARVVTATRLHHLGSVPVEADEHPDEITPGAVAQQGAKILREAGFPPDVADLLELANADAIDAAAPSLEAAVVRAAAIFDEIVGDDVGHTNRGIALVTSSARDPYSQRVAAALLELVASEPTLVLDAVTAGDRFRDAATGLDLESVTSRRTGTGELLPFARRG